MQKHLPAYSLALFLLLPAFLFARPLTPGADTDTAGYYTSFDGVKIYYEQHGSGTPVVLVHGFIVNGESWKKSALYTDLRAKGYRVITMDLRGNGRSDKPHNAEAYAQDAEAKDVMGLLDKLGVTHYLVAGYSRGSIITARLLVLDKRVDKAVMGGMGIDFTNPEWPRRIMFYKALSGEPVKELEQMVNYVKTSGLDQQALACMQKEQPSTPKEELAKWKQPVLVICGDKDPDNGSADALTALIPKATLVLVPGDHNSASRTAEFSREVIRFFEKK